MICELGTILQPMHLEETIVHGSSVAILRNRLVIHNELKQRIEINMVAWGQVAKRMVATLQPGDLLYVEGDLQWSREVIDNKVFDHHEIRVRCYRKYLSRGLSRRRMGGEQ